MGDVLEWWIRRVLRWPVLIVVIAWLGCGASLYYTIHQLGVNTDTTELLSPELPFHQERIRLWKAFPQDVKAIVVAVEAATPERAAQAVRRLRDRLQRVPDAVGPVYVPGEGAYFERSALLYYDLDDLEALTTRISQAQPFISRLQRDNSLSQLLSLVQAALAADRPADAIVPFVDALSDAMAAELAGQPHQLSWQTLMTQRRQRLGGTLRLLLIKPVFDYSRMLPAEKTLLAVRAAAAEVQRSLPGVSIRLTGEVPLEHDDMQSVNHSATIAGVVSFVLVCVTLLIGLRSVGLMVAALLTLVMGLILTGGFAALAIGHLNMISIAFAVLYIGLGVDYAIHLCLHYGEYRGRIADRSQALIASVRDVGPSITLCAVTSSAAFFAFVPTAFDAVSELGVISGTSMFIALVISLTVLPAMLVLMPWQSRAAAPAATAGRLARLYEIPLRHARSIRAIAVVLALVSAVSLTRVTFDFNPVNLRDPGSESVLLFNELLTIEGASPMTLTVLEPDAEAARATALRLESLPSVRTAVTIDDLIPERQPEKLDLIDSLSTLLGPGLEAFPPPSQKERSIEPLHHLLEALDQALAKHSADAVADALRRLRWQTQKLLARLQAAPDDARAEALNRLERSLLETLPQTMRRLGTALAAEPVTLAALPPELATRWISSDGLYRVQVLPQKPLDRIDDLRAFITEVQSVAPTVTDLPVIYLEAGKAVVQAFRQALLTALVAVIVVLLLVLRNVKDTLHVLLPLMLAAMLTGATTVWLDIPVNFANIIALPLLFGLGVDSGIHMIHKLRRTGASGVSVLRSSTARGVLFSALTTIFSFSSLALTAHVGMASMGQMLAIGIVNTLFCTLVILPAFRREGRSGLI